MNVPPVVDARLSLEFRKAFPSVQIEGGYGRTDIDENGRRVAAHLGGTSNFQVRWSTQPEPSHPPTELEARIVRAVEVHPTWLKYRCFVSYEVRHGSVDFLTWQLPGTAIVRSVDAEQLLDYSLRRTGDGTRRLLARFANPHEGPFTVSVSLMVPRSPADDTVRIPVFSLHDRSVRGKTIETSFDRIGLSTSSAFRLEPAEKQNGGATPISPEAFLGDRAASGDVPPPELAYQLAGSDSIPVNLSARTSRRTVHQTQVGRITRERIGWTYTAEVDIDEAPAFRHVLTVDPRLQIDSVSVQEDGAERLARRSRDGRRLTLFLSGKTTGTQLITLEGNLPLVPEATTALPVIRPGSAEVSESELLLYHDPQLEIRIPDSKALKPLEEAGGRNGNGGEQRLLGRYHLRGDHPPPRVHPVFRGRRFHMDTVTVLRPAGGNNWLFASTARFRGMNEGRKPVLRLPGELAGDYRLVTEGAAVRDTRKADGSVRVVLEPEPPARSECSVRVEALLQPPESGKWQLPRLEADESGAGDHYLFVSSESVVADAGASAVRQPAEEVPAWVRRAAEDSANGLDADRPRDEGDLQVYRADSQPWTLARVSAGESGSEPRIPLMETELWLGPESRNFGRTTVFFVAGKTSRNLTWNWADEYRLRAVFVDGEQVKLPAPSSGELAVPVTGFAPAYTITIAWSFPHADHPWPWARYAPRFLQPKGISPEHSLVRMTGPRTASFVRATGMSLHDPAEYALERCEGALRTLQATPSGGNVPPRVRDVLREEYAFLAEQLQTGGTGLSERHGRLRARFEKIRGELEQIASPVVPETHAGSRSARDAPTKAPGLFHPDDGLRIGHGSAVYGVLPEKEPAADSVTVWAVDRRLLAALAGVLGFVVVVLAARQLAQWGLGDLLVRHEALAVAVLGTLWWLCLSPSFIGLALLPLAGLLAFRPFVRATDEGNLYVNDEEIVIRNG